MAWAKRLGELLPWMKSSARATTSPPRNDQGRGVVWGPRPVIGGGPPGPCENRRGGATVEGDCHCYGSSTPPAEALSRTPLNGGAGQGGFKVIRQMAANLD